MHALFVLSPTSSVTASVSFSTDLHADDLIVELKPKTSHKATTLSKLKHMVYRALGRDPNVHSEQILQGQGIILQLKIMVRLGEAIGEAKKTKDISIEFKNLDWIIELCQELIENNEMALAELEKICQLLQKCQDINESPFSAQIANYLGDVIQNLAAEVLITEVVAAAMSHGITTVTRVVFKIGTVVIVKCVKKQKEAQEEKNKNTIAETKFNLTRSCASLIDSLAKSKSTTDAKIKQYLEELNGYIIEIEHLENAANISRLAASKSFFLRELNEPICLVYDALFLISTPDRSRLKETKSNIETQLSSLQKVQAALSGDLGRRQLLALRAKPAQLNGLIPSESEEDTSSEESAFKDMLRDIGATKVSGIIPPKTEQPKTPETISEDTKKLLELISTKISLLKKHLIIVNEKLATLSPLSPSASLPQSPSMLSASVRTAIARSSPTSPSSPSFSLPPKSPPSPSSPTPKRPLSPIELSIDGRFHTSTSAFKGKKFYKELEKQLAHSNESGHIEEIKTCLGSCNFRLRKLIAIYEELGSTQLKEVSSEANDYKKEIESHIKELETKLIPLAKDKIESYTRRISEAQGKGLPKTDPVIIGYQQLIQQYANLTNDYFSQTRQQAEEYGLAADRVKKSAPTPTDDQKHVRDNGKGSLSLKLHNIRDELRSPPTIRLEKDLTQDEKEQLIDFYKNLYIACLEFNVAINRMIAFEEKPSMRGLGVSYKIEYNSHLEKIHNHLFNCCANLNANNMVKNDKDKDLVTLTDLKTFMAEFNKLALDQVSSVPHELRTPTSTPSTTTRTSGSPPSALSLSRTPEPSSTPTQSSPPTPSSPSTPSSPIPTSSPPDQSTSLTPSVSRKPKTRPLLSLAKKLLTVTSPTRSTSPTSPVKPSMFSTSPSPTGTKK